MKKIIQLGVSGASFCAFALASQWLLKDWSRTSVLVGSVFLHELAHIFVLRRFGINSSLLFIPLLGAVTIPSREGCENLSSGRRGVVALAGPLANFILLVEGVLLIPLIRSEVGLRIAALNAFLVFLNLLPLPVLDGGRFARDVFGNLQRKSRKAIASWMIGLSVVLSLIWYLLGARKIFFLYLPAIAFGIKERVLKRENSSGVSAGTKLLLAFYLIALLIVAPFLAFLFLPFW